MTPKIHDPFNSPINSWVDAALLLAQDARIARVIVYHDGFVAHNRYKSFGVRTIYFRLPSGELKQYQESYDRRRQYGRGPSWVAQSNRGGTLHSYHGR